jgi:hypothetical protein
VTQRESGPLKNLYKAGSLSLIARLVSPLPLIGRVSRHAFRLRPAQQTGVAFLSSRVKKLSSQSPTLLGIELERQNGRQNLALFKTSALSSEWVCRQLSRCIICSHMRYRGYHALVAFTDKREILVYSLPHLKLLHLLQGPQSSDPR